jgi:hypothetical protein
MTVLKRRRTRKTLVVAIPSQVRGNYVKTPIAAFEPSLSERIIPGDRLSKNRLVFDHSKTEPSVSVGMPSTTQASTTISIASQIPVRSVTPSSTGQTTIPVGSNAASFALGIIPANRTFNSSVAPFEFAERLASIYDYECSLVFQSPQGQEGGSDWNQRFTKASLLLTATWSYADRFAPAAIGDQYA